jgi:transcriptional regulator with XRE-family HTH domain
VPPTEPADPVLAMIVRQLREARGLTQEDLAHEADLTVGSYARIERAQSNPAWTTVQRIAVALGLTVGELVAVVEAQR